jgi:hypothetical protein
VNYKGEAIIPLATGDSVLIAVSATVPGGGTLTLTAAGASPAYLKPRGLTESVVSSDPSPLGGAYGSFPAATLLSKRDLAFAADTGGVFVSSGGVLTTIAIAGDPTPAGGTFAEFGAPSTNDAGTVVFHARVDGGAVHEGIFAYSAGVISALILEGDAAPGGGTYARFDSDVLVNQSGAVAFHGRTSVDPTVERLFDDCLYAMQGPGGALGAVLCTGDPAPASVGGTVDLFGVPSGTASFAVTAADVSGGGADSCLFTLHNGTLAAAQCSEQPYILGSYIDGLARFATSPAAEMDAKGFVYVQEDQPAVGGLARSLVAVRSEKHYPMFSASYDRSPVSNGRYEYDPLAPPSMSGKTVAFASSLSDGAVSNAVLVGWVP